METKVCKECKRELPKNTDYYFKDKSYKDGYSNKCKECKGYNFTNKLTNIPKEGYKFCIRCSRELPATTDYFYMENGRLMSTCKDCKKSIYKISNDFNFDDWYNNKTQQFRNNWNYDDLKWVYDNYYDIDKHGLLNKFPNKSYKTINNIMVQWDKRKEYKNDIWSQDDIDMLYMYYPNSDEEELVEMFDRSWVAIKAKASKLGVQRSKEILFKNSSLSHKGIIPSLATRVKLSRALKGNKSPNWRGGISTLVPFFRGQIYEWKLQSLEKYDFKCAFTNENNGNLEIHHTYKNFSDILEEAFTIAGLKIEETIENYTDDEVEKLVSIFNKLHFKYGLGIPLSKNIHKLFHSLYGLNNNTKKQFEEFEKDYFSGKFDDALKAMEIENNVHIIKERKKYKQLRKENVINIKDYLRRGYPTSFIAQKFNCSRSAVYNIKTEKTWTDVS